MSETPFHDALEQIPKNELRVEAGASKADGGDLALTLERERGALAGGLKADINQRKGWGVSGFLRWAWGGKKE